MKKKTLLTSILTIVMCLSLTIGATFALFTSKSEVNIAVSSANVDVRAIASELDTDIAYGSANKVGNEITVERMLPGDSFSFDIAIENYSDVAVQYRTVISNTDGGLFKALKITITEDKEQRVYNGGYVYEDWATLTPTDVDATTADNVRNINVLVEFPDTGVAQNQYQGKTCTMKVLVEAVQGNAKVVNPVTKINDRHYEINSVEGMMLVDGILAGTYAGEGVPMKLELTDNIDMEGMLWTPIEKMWVEFDGNGFAISNLNCGHTSWGRSGFFGYIGGGSVKNLILENVTAEGTQVGIVAGALEGTVENVTIKGDNYVKYNREINPSETWGGVGVVAGVAQPMPISNIVVDGNVTVDYNGIISCAPYTGVNALITNIDSGVTTNGTVTVKDRYIQYVADGFGLDKDGNYLVLSKAGLFSFANLVNNGKTFADETVLLDSSINLENDLWTPIGPNADANNKFKGTFDGQNYTIYNLKVAQGAGYHAAGLFGALGKGTIKNLKIDGAEISNLSSGAATDNGTAVVAGSIYSEGVIDNVQVFNATVNGNRYVGGIAGYVYGSITNCRVEGTEIIADFDDLTGSWDNADKVGGIAGYFPDGAKYVVNGNVVKDTTVKGYRDVGGIVGYARDSITNNTVENVAINVNDTHNYKNYTNLDEFDLGLVVGDGDEDASNTIINSIVEFGATSVVTSAETVQEAINNGSTNLVLGSNINLTGAIEIPDTSSVTINTGAYSLIKDGATSYSMRAVANHTIVNKGTLTITGDGWVLASEKDANAVYNEGTLILEGSVAYQSAAGYAIANVGELIMNGGYVQKSFGLIRTDAGKVTINNGYIGITTAPTSTHVLRAENSEVIINGGNFVHGENAGSTLYVCANASVTVNGGKLKTNSTSYLIDMAATTASVTINGGDVAGDCIRAFQGSVAIKGGNIDVETWHANKDVMAVTGGTYTNKAAEQYITGTYSALVEKDGKYIVTIKPEVAKEIADTLANGGTVELEGDYAPVATAGGYSQAGLVQKGGVIDGKGNTISASNSNGTWDCTVYTNGGTIKNAIVSGGFRGIFTAGLNQDLFIENVIFDDVTYTFSADDGNVNYGVYFTDCVLNGWTSFTNKFKEVVFTGCTFGEGRGYAYCRPYNQTKFVNCHFEEGYAIDGSRNVLYFENCTFGADKTLLTIENYKELISGFKVGSINGDFIANSSENLDVVLKKGATSIYLLEGTYVIPGSAARKTLTITGIGNVVVNVPYHTAGENCDGALDSSNVTFNDIIFATTSGTFTGYARLAATYNNCTFNGTYTTYLSSVFNNCEFNVSGDVYAIWTWGAPEVTFTDCTFNTDGKAILLYGPENTNLTVDGCTFNDKGGLADLKAAIEIGNDYGKSYTLTVNNTVVNGYEINDKGINTGTTLWGNKNSMGTDKLNVVVDGVDVY